MPHNAVQGGRGIRMLFATSLAGLAVAAFGGPAHAADDMQGAQIAATCASCHDPGGSAQDIPRIAGLEEQKIITAIRAYRESESPSHVMHAVALSLSEEELVSVARYLATHGEDATSP